MHRTPKTDKVPAWWEKVARKPPSSLRNCLQLMGGKPTFLRNVVHQGLFLLQQVPRHPCIHRQQYQVGSVEYDNDRKGERRRKWRGGVYMNLEKDSRTLGGGGVERGGEMRVDLSKIHRVHV